MAFSKKMNVFYLSYSKQCAALHAVAQTADYLEENAVRKMVLPRTKQVFENNNGIKVSFKFS